MRKYIIGLITGIILASGVAGVVAYNYSAKNIGYTPSDSNWNVNNVEDAIKNLYENKDAHALNNSSTLVAHAWGNRSAQSDTVTINKNQKARFIAYIRAQTGTQAYCRLYINGEEKINHTSQTAGVISENKISSYDIDLKSGDSIYIVVHGANISGEHTSLGILEYDNAN